ncbi:MAG: type II toxin-antitoxin system VapC family toxin [Gammaproteobacteria bacterium]|nr:type II toxin-antitoxin system VapC family toxin [Gammaproteobacteria bacterium]
MSYLIDTNVISEITRKAPNKNVEKWFTEIPSSELYLSVLTIGEIRRGIQSLKDQYKKENLRIWLEHALPHWFGNRIINIDSAVADCWGRLLAEAKRPMATIDSMIAASALQHNLALVTRNTKDFDYPLLTVINPWEW